MNCVMDVSGGNGITLVTEYFSQHVGEQEIEMNPVASCLLAVLLYDRKRKDC